VGKGGVHMENNQQEKSKKRVRHLKAIFIGGIILFFVIYLLITLSKLGLFVLAPSKTTTVNNPTVDFEQPKLHLFDETLYLNEFPDTIRMHNPYLIIVQPEERKSQIVNLTTQKKEKETMDIPLDYWKGDMLYNWHGTTTYYNKKSLNLHCDEGFIKSATEILCVTAKANDPLDNKLISLNPKTGAQHEVYSSQNLITAVYYVDRVLYVGEVNIVSKKTYILAGDIMIETPSSVDVVYQMNNAMYYGTFKSAQINRQAAYYQIQPDKKRVLLQATGKILFFTLQNE